MYNGPCLIQRLGNWASLIGPNLSMYFEAELSGPMLNGPINWTTGLIGG